MTAEQAIELYRAEQAKRADRYTPQTHHTWQDERRKPVEGGFRIIPIPTDWDA